MNDLQKARRPALGGPGGAGVEAFASGNGNAIVHARARAVKPLIDQAAQLEAHHRAQAAWHRARAARWLAWAHLSPWHSSHWREHMDAAAWHEKLAARHAQIGESLEGVTDGHA